MTNGRGWSGPIHNPERATGHMQSSPEASVLFKVRIWSEDRAGGLSASPDLKARGLPQKARASDTRQESHWALGPSPALSLPGRDS